MYLEMESSPDLLFELFLAEKLHMTVGRLREEMSNEEFLLWNTYYARRSQQEELENLKGG
jgi:hypothetical protein